MTVLSPKVNSNRKENIERSVQRWPTAVYTDGPAQVAEPLGPATPPYLYQPPLHRVGTPHPHKAKSISFSLVLHVWNALNQRLTGNFVPSKSVGLCRCWASARTRTPDSTPPSPFSSNLIITKYKSDVTWAQISKTRTATIMDQGDGTPGGNLTLADFYRQLMELDSISQALTHEISSAQLQSITAQHIVSSSATEGHWPGPDDWPGDFFENLVRELNQARCIVDSLHYSMREVADASSRSRLRPLNILDLPNELLRKIFEDSMMEGESNEDYLLIPEYRDWGCVENIRNTRLTCRRFCNTSSHLLVRHVDVTMNPSSIAHLEEVARHPLISYGVQAVRVHLNYFSAELART